MLQDQARDVRIVAGQHQLRRLRAYRMDRPDQVGEHVDIVDSDLQHHAARHARGLVAPGGEIDLAEAIAADVRLGVDELAEPAGFDLLPDIAEMALAPPLIAERQHHAGLAAGLGDGAAVRDAVGDRLVQKDVLAGGCGRAGRRQMHIVRRRVDDRLDLGIGQQRLVARGRPAAVFCREVFAFFLGPGVAAADLELARALDGIRQNVGPPSHPDTSHAERIGTHHFAPPRAELLCHSQFAPIDSTASLAIRKSVSQSPPLTPTPPMHSRSTSTGTPPSMAVHRSGPAASASPIAWLTSRS